MLKAAINENIFFNMFKIKSKILFNLSYCFKDKFQNIFRSIGALNYPTNHHNIVRLSL